jgi:hypothetical protein
MAAFVANSWGFILLGICAGILSGALGVGSGILFIPMLVWLFAFPQKSAQGAALAVMVPMALVGALGYWMNKDIPMDLLPILLLALGAVPGAILGAELAGRIPADRLRQIFAIFIIIVGIRMLWIPSKPVKVQGPSPTSQIESSDTGKENSVGN